FISSLLLLPLPHFFFFSFTATPTTDIYTLSLHDALPICLNEGKCRPNAGDKPDGNSYRDSNSQHGCSPSAAQATCPRKGSSHVRSEEHTSELQSLAYLVCRLLLEKKKKKIKTKNILKSHE